MSDIKLRIRHAKRGNEKTLDLSGLGLTDIPVDITQLTMLETLNVSNNKLKSLARVEQLPALREINAQNNQIMALHIEIQDMYCLDSINLVGNPVVNTCPELANIRCNEDAIQAGFAKYFGGTGGGATAALGSSPSTAQVPQSMNQRDVQEQKFAASMSSGQGSTGKSFNSIPSSNSSGTAQTLRPMASTSMLNNANSSFTSSNAPVGGVRSGVGKPTFLNSQAQESGVNQDEAQLRRRVMELEIENNKLKMGGSMNSQGPQDRDWMNSFSSSQGAVQQAAPVQMARPMTASSSNQKVRELETTLKEERKHQKRLQDNIESLKKELGKQNFNQFTGGSEVSVMDGRLPQVPGVREIALEDLEFGEQIGQGGFSVIHKGYLNGTPVAIKKIFDPNITDDLLAEIQNEIVMTAILRHPNIALLMGVAPKIPNIAIVSEYVDQGSLFNLLHMKKNQVKLDLPTRLRFALEAGRVFQYMHQLGIVHRDIKSMNVLVSSNMQIKVCDFGLAKFKADLGKGSMQYAGTPVYMAPELFQKRQYDETVDVFAFGALLWECITREVPYDGLESIDIRSKVEKGEPLKLPYDTDQRLTQLVNATRQVQPTNRLILWTFKKNLDIIVDF